MAEGNAADRAEVIVAGGGLVGPALALALARSGFAVVVVDRLAEAVRADPAFDGRGYAIALGSARVLGALGLWQDLEARAQPIADIRVSEGSADAPRAQLHFDPRALAEARVGWILEDRWLRNALLEAMAAEPGVRHIAPAEIAAAAFDGVAATLTLADGRTLEAPLVIAADGRRSALAAMGGIGRQVLRYGQRGLVASVEHERSHEGVAWQSFFPGGPFAVLPLPGARSAIVWSERAEEAERLGACDDARFEAALARRIGGRLGDVRLAGPRATHGLDLVLADAYARPRLALAGDAAHGVHPIAGQGLNMGLRDVAALVEVLAAAARRGEDIGDLAVLRRYERWRRFDNTALALGTDALNRLFSTANPLAALARSAGLAVVERLPRAKRFFMREASGLSGELPEMLRGRLP